LRLGTRILMAVWLAAITLPAAELDTVIVRPKEIHDVLVNPGIGFTTFQRFNGDDLNPGRDERQFTTTNTR